MAQRVVLPNPGSASYHTCSHCKGRIVVPVAPAPEAPKQTEDYIYVDEAIKEKKEIVATVLDQLTDEERGLASAEESDVRVGEMGFVCRSDSKVIINLRYVGRRDGKHVWKRS